MIRDLSLAAKASCSKEDQESLVPLVKQLKILADLTIKSGALSLETEMMKIEDPFLRLGMELLVDGISAKNIQDILDIDIYYNESSGKELLKKIIVREGILRMKAGETGRNILIFAKFYLGKLDNSYWK